MVSCSMFWVACFAVLLAAILALQASDWSGTAAEIEASGPVAVEVPAASSSGSIAITLTGILEDEGDSGGEGECPGR